MSDAFTIIAATKTKLSDVYMMKNRFPKNQRELEAMATDRFSKPEFVERVVLGVNRDDNDIVVQLHFNEDVIPGIAFNEEFLYVAGNSTSASGVSVECSCGLSGIDEKYMPTRCAN